MKQIEILELNLFVSTRGWESLIWGAHVELQKGALTDQTHILIGQGMWKTQHVFILTKAFTKSLRIS